MRRYFRTTKLRGRYAPQVKSTLLVALYLYLGASAEFLYCQEQAPSSNDAALEAPPSVAARAAEELRVEEQQRILRVVPEFNITNVHDAAPLSAKQKFQLAFKGEVDPATFVAAGIYAGLSQWQKGSPSYGYGMQGYGKRFGAAYLDAFDGSIIGDAMLPAVLHQDPRYFRQGQGSFISRFMHAIDSAYRCKGDDGKWTWNYSNVLGNVAAGAISNAYYPSSDRGVAPTFERAFTVTAEGAVGAVFFEFWPDISRKFLTRKKKAQS